MSAPLLDVQMSFRAPCQKWAAALYTLDRWSGKKTRNALVRGRQLCTQLSIFEGSLAELLRFWCCQLRKLWKSRRIASFLTLSSSKIEEILAELLMLSSSKWNKSRRTTTTTTLHYTTLRYSTLHYAAVATGARLLSMPPLQAPRCSMHARARSATWVRRLQLELLTFSSRSSSRNTTWIEHCIIKGSLDV